MKLSWANSPNRSSRRSTSSGAVDGAATPHHQWRIFRGPMSMPRSFTRRRGRRSRARSTLSGWDRLGGVLSGPGCPGQAARRESGAGRRRFAAAVHRPGDSKYTSASTTSTSAAARASLCLTLTADPFVDRVYRWRQRWLRVNSSSGHCLAEKAALTRPGQDPRGPGSIFRMQAKASHRFFLVDLDDRRNLETPGRQRGVNVPTVANGRIGQVRRNRRVEDALKKGEAVEASCGPARLVHPARTAS